jgi:hypothetical protein
MQTAKAAFSSRRGPEWTAERIGRLGDAELQQLRANAERLGATAVVELCDVALTMRPRSATRGRSTGRAAKRSVQLTSRSKAFQARGVYLAEVDCGWSGVRSADGAVVMSLWAPAIVAAEGLCSQLLWAPNREGARPWSDSAAGKERLRHCQLALERGAAEGLLVYGECFDGENAEHNARSVHGADGQRVVEFRVEQRGDEYWAVWGAKVAGRAL